MESRSPDSGPSPYSALPDPCDRCKQTTCLSLHSYSASTCPYNVCPECQELGALDAQIMDLHNRLIILSNKRHELKGRINRRHDRFTSDLPIELISDVFALIVDAASDRLHRENDQCFRWNPVLMLGAVCRQWRDITLGNPAFWTKISIGPQKRDSFSDFTPQWLSRSGNLPLLLELRSSITKDHGDQTEPTPNLPCPSAVQLLRSHAYRWKDLHLQGTTAILPMVLAGLEEKLVVDSLRISIYAYGDPKINTIAMRYPFVPKRLDMYNVPLPAIPLQWERLTYFKAESNAVDGLLYIIHHAHNLEHCILHSVQEDEGHYPISTAPATNVSVKELDVYVGLGTAFLLRHLTFPSLEILHYSKPEGYEEEDIDALSEFLHRSQPPLHDFSFCRQFSRASADVNWYSIFPSITSLELDMIYGNKETMQICIDSLGPHVEPMALPCLRDLKLKIGTANMSPHWWNTLIEVIPGRKISEDTTRMFSRPLKTVTVTIHPSCRWELRPPKSVKIDDASYSRLRAVQDSGVELKVLNKRGIDILGPNNVEFTELEYDDDSDENDLLF